MSSRGPRTPDADGSLEQSDVSSATDASAPAPTDDATTPPAEAPSEAAPLTRKRLRASGAPEAASDADPVDPADPIDLDAVSLLLAEASAPPTPPRAALEWVDPASLERRALGPAVAPQPALAPLVARWPARRPSLTDVITPVAVTLVAVIAYAAAALLWPLTAVQPHLESVGVPTSTAVASSPAWPAVGEASISITGAGTISSGTDALRMASIAKVLTALVVLEAKPIAAGEQGESYTITQADRQAYVASKAAGESTLPFAAGDTFTEYQLLEGMLVGSAGNYADKLVGSVFTSEAAYLKAARAWLDAQGISGITVTDNTGFGRTNTATPEALTALGAKAMANPVIAEIVGKKQIDLPTAGSVQNTNELLGDEGVVGIKTGTLDGVYNLLVARDVTAGSTTVRVYASVLGQPSDAARWSSARTLLDSVAKELTPTIAVPAGTIVGHVSTAWGAASDVITTSDARVTLWNGASASTTPSLSLPEDRTKDASAGTYTVTGALDEAQVDTALTRAVPGPSAWWRLTHPFELLGITAWR